MWINTFHPLHWLSLNEFQLLMFRNHTRFLETIIKRIVSCPGSQTLNWFNFWKSLIVRVLISHCNSMPLSLEYIIIYSMIMIIISGIHVNCPHWGSAENQWVLFFNLNILFTFKWFWDFTFLFVAIKVILFLLNHEISFFSHLFSGGCFFHYLRNLVWHAIWCINMHLLIQCK